MRLAVQTVWECWGNLEPKKKKKKPSPVKSADD